MHFANAIAWIFWASVGCGSPVPPGPPPHAFCAATNAGADEMGVSCGPLAPGSGKLVTPWLRMHWANLTPSLMLARAAGFVDPPHAVKPKTPTAAAINIPSARTPTLYAPGCNTEVTPQRAPAGAPGPISSSRFCGGGLSRWQG